MWNGALVEAVIVALRARLVAIQRRQVPGRLAAELEERQAFVRSQPDRNGRAADEIRGYDHFGLPG